MIARLQAATGSKAPILLRTSDDSGHGGNTPLAAQIRETVDVYAFIFDQLGIKYRAPAAK
jgi:prolyl oligopeptidase